MTNPQPNSFTHPECPIGFVFIGNMTRAAYEQLDWSSKKEGQICYEQSGELIHQGAWRAFPEKRLVPVFVSRDEFEARQGTPQFVQN